ncbi:hypothetical protein [Legionella nagasakiensis]|uniref:RNA polymerase factor sigma-54 n=1 Tax=Legionella nagasakiensis TaxID=535290 RepID=UPI0010542BC5|nr:hypothetical protein [Legionella nagasakiensis]
MKVSLQLKMNQQLKLTPQLQQSIRLLQLSTVELQQEIQHEIESNPMLELKDDNQDEWQSSVASFSHERCNTNLQISQYPDKRHHFDLDDSSLNYENCCSTTSDLRAHLRWQLDLTPMSDIDRAIGLAIIDAINEDGFLTLPLTELHAMLSSRLYPVDIEEIVVVKHRIQRFDPIGCATNDLVEALLVQLDFFEQTPDVLLAKQMVCEDIELLGHRHYRQLMKKYHMNDERLHHIIHIIKQLNPKPGS